MYFCAYHQGSGLLASYFSGATNQDKDYQTFMEASMTLDQEHQHRPEGVVHLVVLSAESPRPNATWRAKFAGLTGEDARGKKVGGEQLFIIW